MEIVIDWKKVKSEGDFYDIFLPQVRAPNWHEHSLDALSNSVIRGGVNDIEPPYTVKSLNTSKVIEGLVSFQVKVLAIFNEAHAESRGVVVETG